MYKITLAIILPKQYWEKCPLQTHLCFPAMWNLDVDICITKISHTRCLHEHFATKKSPLHHENIPVELIITNLYQKLQLVRKGCRSSLWICNTRCVTGIPQSISVHCCHQSQIMSIASFHDYSGISFISFGLHLANLGHCFYVIFLRTKEVIEVSQIRKCTKVTHYLIIKLPSLCYRWRIYSQI